MMKELASLAQLVKGRNPEQIVLSMLKNTKIEDPTIAQLIQLAQSGDMNTFNNLASSIFTNSGLNMEEELNSFLSMLK